MSYLPAIESLSDKTLWRIWCGRQQHHPLVALAAAKVLQERLDTQRWAVVTQALDDGASWRQIAEALGVRKQSAWEAYQHYLARQTVAPAEPAMSRSMLVETLRRLPRSDAWRGWLLGAGSLARELSDLEEISEMLRAWSADCSAAYWRVVKMAEANRDETALRYVIRVIEGLQGAAAHGIPHYRYEPDLDLDAAVPVVPWVPEELAASEAPEAQALTAAADQALQAARAAAAVAAMPPDPETDEEDQTAVLAAEYLPRLVAYADAGLRVLATIWADRLTQAHTGNPQPFGVG